MKAGMLICRICDLPLGELDMFGTLAFGKDTRITCICPACATLRDIIRDIFTTGRVTERPYYVTKASIPLGVPGLTSHWFQAITSKFTEMHAEIGFFHWAIVAGNLQEEPTEPEVTEEEIDAVTSQLMNL